MTFADDPIRFSHLKAYGRSAAHGLQARTAEWKPTKAMQLGTAVHALAFKTKKVAAYDGVRRGKAWEQFRDENTDTHLLSPGEYYNASKMAEALLQNKDAVSVMEGVVETTINFDWYGRKCRATPDVRTDLGITELKTSASSDPAKFVWQSAKMAYHAQCRMQQIACGMEVFSPAHIVVVESAAPFPVTVFRLTEDALIAGEKLLCLWMERLKACEAAQEWPAYVQSIVPLDLPGDVDLDFGDEE